MIDISKITEFRDEVNQDEFVLSQFKDVNGRDQWGCICSAMDWITVAAEYIIQFDTEREYIQSMEMYSYISSIDVVWEGIQQLHRVLFQKQKPILFSDRHNCFVNRCFEEMSDNDYFKEIRACFGAHPVNLKGEGEERLFASWSGNSNESFSVLLYSSTPDKPFVEMKISIRELNEFLEERYNYLDVLRKQIQNLRTSFYSYMKGKKILRSGNIIEQLKILKDEIHDRGDYVQFQFIVNELLMIFDTPIIEEENMAMVESYRMHLITLVNDLYLHIQNMDMSNIDDGLLFPRPVTLRNGYIYWIEKISSYISGAGYSPVYWEEKLREIFDGKFVMRYESYQEFYVLILSCMDELVQREKATGKSGE